jgi:hypothetical protein
MTENDLPEDDIEESEGETNDIKFVSLYKQVMEMSVSEKIKLASVGNKEARNLLIKDSNKIVVHAVINSPKLNDDEVVAFAGNMNLSKDVPRIISDMKKFMKNYNVKLALVKNAKTPLPTALKLLAHLREPDLQKISKSKNVSSILSRTAMKTLASRRRR